MELRKITLSALFIAVGAALTKVTGAGFTFLYIAVLLCSLTLGPRYGLMVGVLAPLTAFMTTGMIAPMITPIMMFREIPALAVYGFTLGLCMKSGSCRNYCNTKIYAAITIATLASRVVAGVVTALFFGFGDYIFTIWIVFELIGTLPILAIDIFSARMITPAIRKVDGFKYLHAVG